MGLEAQRLAVEAYARATGSGIVASFTEIESGKKKDRPELLKAIRRTKTHQGTLVIAKLDRLARNVLFVATLMESKVPFVCCDMPHANPLTIHILAAIAEHEAKMISQRTKEALAAYKAAGGVLGPPGNNLTTEAQRLGARLGAESQRLRAKEHHEEMMPLMLKMRYQGHTFDEIAQALNYQGFTTRRGNPWKAISVWFVLNRERGEAGPGSRGEGFPSR